jgi:hypothetical protein
MWKTIRLALLGLIGFWKRYQQNERFTSAYQFFFQLEYYYIILSQGMEKQMPNHQVSESAPSRGVVLTKAVMRAADRLGMSGKLLSNVLGLSEAQVSRMKNGEAALTESSKAFELSALLVRVFRSLDAIVGGDERTARVWVVSQNAALHGRPIDRMVSIQGLADVVTYLDARRAPI